MAKLLIRFIIETMDTRPFFRIPAPCVRNESAWVEANPNLNTCILVILVCADYVLSRTFRLNTIYWLNQEGYCFTAVLTSTSTSL